MRPSDFGPQQHTPRTYPFYGPVVGRAVSGEPMRAGALTEKDRLAMKEQVKKEGVFIPKKLSVEWGLTVKQVHELKLEG